MEPSNLRIFQINRLARTLKMSSTTKQMHRMLLKALILQSFVPLVVIVAPMLVITSSALVLPWTGNITQDHLHVCL